MLGKLIKNSFKANAYSVYPTYIAMGIIGTVMAVLVLVDWTRWGDTGVGVGLAIKGVASFALVLTALVGVVLTFIAVFREFQNSMYRREGQLTLSLPVKSSSLLFAKWLSGSFWVILSYTALCLCAFGSFLYLMRHSMGVIEGDESIFSIYTLVTEMVSQFAEAAGINAPSLTVVLNLVSLYAISGGIKACVFVILVYFGVTLSHCRPFHKLGTAGSILYFFGGFAVSQTFSSLIDRFLKIFIVVSEDAFTFTLSQAEVEAAWARGFGAFSITETYCSVIMAVAFFLITTLLIERKVNVD